MIHDRSGKSSISPRIALEQQTEPHNSSQLVSHRDIFLMHFFNARNEILNLRRSGLRLQVRTSQSGFEHDFTSGIVSKVAQIRCIYYRVHNWEQTFLTIFICMICTTCLFYKLNDLCSINVTFCDQLSDELSVLYDAQNKSY